MYCHLRPNFFWVDMKKDLALFVAKCLEFHLVKGGNHHPEGLLEPHDILKAKMGSDFNGLYCRVTFHCWEA
jgi:hypothetical protein